MKTYITKSGNIHFEANLLLEEKFKWAYENLYNACISNPNKTAKTVAVDGTLAQAMYLQEDNILLFKLEQNNKSIRSFLNLQKRLN